MTQYELWCSFYVSHSYYRDSICRNLTLVPDEDTQYWLRQEGLRWFQSAANSWQLYGPVPLGLTNFVSEKPPQKLIFKAASSDPDFIQFTQFPVDQLGYFEFSNAALQPSETPKINIPGKFKVKTSVSNTIAIVSLDLGAIKSTATQYQISFEARKTRWQYYVVQQQQSLKGSLLLQGKKASLFAGPELKIMRNGIATECFDSKTNLLVLQEIGAVQLSLSILKESGPSSTAQLLIEHLPNPNPSSLSSAQDGEKDLISAMYIYV